MSALNVTEVQHQGFTLLHEPPAGEEVIADIVFIHGLQGHPRNTWTWESDARRPDLAVPIDRPPKRSIFKKILRKRETAVTPFPPPEKVAPKAVFWPCHLLPQDCSNARIFTWGYDSVVVPFFAAPSKNGIVQHARNFQEDLIMQRRKCPKRPLIFVAHSLGGIIVKDMLLRAKDVDVKGSNDLVDSTKAILFLGTPHMGSHLANTGDVLRAIVAATGFDTANQNLEVLKAGGMMLEQIRERFYGLHRRQGFEVYTFEEELGMTGIGFAKFGNKVVPPDSSEFLGSAGSPTTIPANHMMMCRYSSEIDPGYQRVAGRLQRVCEKMQDERNLVKQAAALNVQTSDIEARKAQNAIDDAHLDTLAFPEMGYRKQDIEDAYADSCDWIYENQTYLDWNHRGRGLLGIRGKPGSGKSTLMKKIFAHLEQESAKKEEPEQEIQLDFFFHRRGQILQQTVLGMFRTLLFELLSQVPSVRDEFRSRCDERNRRRQPGQAMEDWRMEELRSMFSSAVLTAAKTHDIRIFIDALDEASYSVGDVQDGSHHKAAKDVVSFLHRLNNQLLLLPGAARICFSCRHYPDLGNTDFEISLDDNNHDAIASYTLAELKLYVRFNSETQVEQKQTILASFQEQIVSKASGVFMWVALVIPLIAEKHNEGESLAEIQRTLDSVPEDLEEIYHHILTKVVKPEKRAQTLNLMSWIFFAKRPLSVRELRYALTLDDSLIQINQKSCKQSEGFVNSDTRMERLVKSLSGGLVEVITHPYDYHSQVKDDLDSAPLSEYPQEVTVQFIHQSVSDFISRDQFRCLELGETKNFLGQGHDRLARSCINYLKFEEAQCLEPPNWEMNPFMDYAHSFLFSHAAEAERAGISQQDLVRRFEWPSDELMQRWINGCRSDCNSWWQYLCANLLQAAAASNLQTVVQELLQRKVSVEEEDSRGNTAMHYAAIEGNVQILMLLLDAKARTSVINQLDQTPVFLAAVKGHEETVKLLLDFGEDINNSTSNPLQAAARHGQLDTMKLLLAMGANVNVQGGEYGNALQVASSLSSLVVKRDVVELLLAKGANVNAQGGFYGTALQAASYCGDRSVVELLLAKGANVNTQGGFCGTALQAASCYGDRSVVELLLAKGVNVNTQGESYGNALHAAFSRGNKDIVELLLAKGADADTLCGDFGTALQAASYKGHNDIVELLLAKGAEVNIQGGKFGTALQAASYAGYKDVVELLLDNGADVNAPGTGTEYRNALHAARSKSRHDIVKLLLANGAVDDGSESESES